MAEQWIKEYVDCLKAGDFSNMLLLKEVNFPKSFFKYRNLNVRSLDNIEKGYQWISEINKLNDPFECTLLLDNNAVLKDMFSHEATIQRLLKKGFTHEEITILSNSSDAFQMYKDLSEKKGIAIPFSSSEQNNRFQNSWQADFLNVTNKMRICSFSTINDSILLWALYSDEARGICIEYDFLNENKIRPFMQPVFYNNDATTVKTFQEMNSYYHIAASISKSEHWEYEREWRFTLLPGSTEIISNILNVPTPIAIYTGVKYEQNDNQLKKRLEEIAKKLSIPIFQMEKHVSEYRYILKQKRDREI